MRTLKIAVVAFLALVLAAPAFAQVREMAKPRRANNNSAAEQAKKKAIDKDYNATLKRIPATSEKPDPWGKMR